MADAQAAQEDGVGDSLEGAESALRLAKEVLRRMEEAGHVEGRAAAKHVMAKACLAGGQAEAVAEAQEALQLFRALGHLEGEAATLDVLAQAQLQEDPQTAFHSASSGREIFRRLGDRRASMLERSALGALLACGQLDEALKEAEASVRRCRRDPGDRREEAAALVMLAEVPEGISSRSGLCCPGRRGDLRSGDLDRRPATALGWGPAEPGCCAPSGCLGTHELGPGPAEPSLGTACSGDLSIPP
ncbi:unnamed protein product [Durusdinium trenchii]|uniref:Uncharacterized protein n=1 Tax=Durusdinium trenchii TaxID=1381693 RepID=A0ABP0HRL2_9DINO